MFFFEKNIDSFIAACIGIIIILLLTKHGGVGISPDSIYYLGTANNLQKGLFLIQHDAHPLVLFPAGYSLFLAAIIFFFKTTILNIAPFLNAFLFGGLIFLCGIIMNAFSKISLIYKRIILIIICFSISLTEVYSMLWSETLFIIVVFSFIFSLRKYLQKSTVLHFIVITVIAALACITRYAGVSIVVLGLLFLLIQKNVNFKSKVIRIVLFFIGSTFFLLLNLIRNYAVSSTLTGIRQHGINSLFTNIKLVGLVFCNWLPFMKVNSTVALIVAIIFIGVAVLIFLYRLISNEATDSYEFIALSFFLIYLCFIVTIATLSRFETINNRMLAPLFICWVWSFTYFIPSALKSIQQGIKKKISISIVIIIVISFLIFEAKAVYTAYTTNIEAGIGGYAEDIWDDSATLYFIKRNAHFFTETTTIYSNANEAVYLFANKVVENLPERVHANFVKHFFLLHAFYIIWLNNTGNPDCLNMEEIARTKRVTSIITFNDGVIYYCTDK